MTASRTRSMERSGWLRLPTAGVGRLGTALAGVDALAA